MNTKECNVVHMFWELYPVSLQCLPIIGSDCVNELHSQSVMKRETLDFHHSQLRKWSTLQCFALGLVIKSSDPLNTLRQGLFWRERDERENICFTTAEILSSCKFFELEKGGKDFTSAQRGGPKNHFTYGALPEANRSQWEHLHGLQRILD